MNFREEVLKIFGDHYTAATRELHLRRLFRVTGEALGTPVHETVCGLFKAKLPEDAMEGKLRALVGTQIKPEVSSEAKALADEIRNELGLTKVDPEEATKAMLAKAYPTMIGRNVNHSMRWRDTTLASESYAQTFTAAGELWVSAT
jgi:hypothetical protein